ncbi:MAG: chromate efflux transporter [Pseudomonadota bacterium]|nr:chromate efflux transporter [Pseudomonadota bacterium]
MTDAAVRRTDPPSFRQALKVWATIGVLSFGGPAGQIALMNRILVDERRWLTEEEFLHALNFCMLLPGPEAMQLATYAGWRLHGWRGGLAAGLLFVVPGAVVILLLAALYAAYGQVTLVAGLFYGIKAAVLAIVVEALLRVARKSLKRASDWLIAAAAFAALCFFALPFPLVVLAAGFFGYLRAGGAAAPTADFSRTAWQHTALTALGWLALWLVPVLALILSLGSDHVFSQVALFFSKLAIVTFGGAYAVLAYMAQQAVEVYGWLKPAEMVDGLGLAETTPGPLILVTEFVGYLAGYRLAGGFWGGVAAALITLWVTFVPCFLMIFTAAPYIERLRTMPRLSAALEGITAAVVGVILNLTVWFALHVLFGRVAKASFGPVQTLVPDVSTISLGSVALLALAAVLLFRLHAGIPATLATCSALGFIIYLLF